MQFWTRNYEWPFVPQEEEKSIFGNYSFKEFEKKNYFYFNLA